MFQFIFESSSELQIQMYFPILVRRKFYNPSYHFVHLKMIQRWVATCWVYDNNHQLNP